MAEPADSRPAPVCRVTSRYVAVADGGSRDESPVIYEARDLRGDWGFSRKDFLRCCSGFGCLGLLAVMGVGIASSSKGCDTSDPTGGSGDSSPAGGGGGGGQPGTYCECDQICTCVPVV
jgi:hypothetical protein